MQSPIHYIEIVTNDVEVQCQALSDYIAGQFEGPVVELGNARVALRDDGILCGIRAPMDPAETPTTRIYLRVDNLDQAVSSVREQGAAILLENMPIAGRGSIAIYELGGIQHGFWQVD